MKNEFLNFSKYVRRQELARFIAQYELFKKILNIKGSVIECGVYLGAGVLAWAKISEILEPYNFLRKIYGFDTFKGFPSVSKKDTKPVSLKTTSTENARVGYLGQTKEKYPELLKCVEEFNKTRLIRHEDKIILEKGDALKTIPKFIKTNPHVLVSLLYLDFDLYEPTKIALEKFLPRIPKGGIIAFDELHDPKWPGETQAMLKTFNLNNYRLESFPFEPHISWITIT